MEKYSYSNPEDVNSIVEEPGEYYDSRRDFTTLEAWIKCRDVKIYFYKNIIPLLPSEEKYNIGIQIRKAAISTTANIAEGYGRYHYKEGIQFYRISRGSLYELKDHLISCYDLGFVNSELIREGEQLIEQAKIILNGYISFVNNKLKK